MQRPLRMAVSAAFVAVLALPLPVLAAGTASAAPRDCVTPAGLTYQQARAQGEIDPDCQPEDVTVAPATSTATPTPQPTSSSPPPSSTSPDTTPDSPTPDTTPDTTPRSETPPSQTPPSQTPPSQTPPSQTPPSQTPPSQTPPSQTPPSQTPVMAAPPLAAPPVAGLRPARPGTAAGTIDPALLGGAPAAGLDPSLLMSPGGGAGGLASVLGAEGLAAGFIVAPVAGPLTAVEPATMVDLRAAGDGVTTSSRVDTLPERSRSQVQTSTLLAFVLGAVLSALLLRRAARLGRR